MNRTRPAPLHALTGLRFVAAAVVVLYHYRLSARGRGEPTGAFTLDTVIAHGHLGVSFFFLLSGFILLYTFGDYDRPAALDTPRFWRARFARIYPVYLVGFALGAIPFYWYNAGSIPPGPLWIAGLSLTLVQSWIPSASNTWNSPGWSLSDEAFFYGLFPWLRRWALTRSTRQLASLLTMCWLALLAAPIVVALSVVALHGGPDPFGGDTHNLLTREPPLRVPEFVAGVTLGSLYVRRRAAHGMRRSRLQGDIAVGATLLAIIGLLSVPIVLPPYIQLYVLVDPLFACLIYALARYDSTIARCLSSRPFRLLGNASYAIYIVHYPLLYIIGGLWSHSAVFPTQNPLFLPAYLATVLIMSLVLYRYVERPLRRLLLELSLSPPRRLRLLMKPRV